jgi:hypothetical protein
MAAKTTFPAQVTVVATPPKKGLAVYLCFAMSRKNNFHYLVFLDSAGSAAVSGNELLKSFDEQCDNSLMDFANPRTAFTGRVTAEVLSAAQLDDALNAFQMFRRHFSFPAGYGQTHWPRSPTTILLACTWWM